MKTTIIFLLLLSLLYSAEKIQYHPISHASFVIESADEVIYVDPVGEPKRYSSFPAPTIILITDIHGDHLAPELVKEIRGEADLIAPSAALEKVNGIAMNNGDTLQLRKSQLIAVPMYNLTEERLKFHAKGRGNGYLLNIDGKRIYISGDTEDIPEMRALKNIDDAFLCMNLPYTMTVEQAVSAVQEFRPARVFPYHYRGKKDGKRVFSDVNDFKKRVEKTTDTKVVLLKWYDSE